MRRTLSVRLSVCLSVYLSVCPSICPSVPLSSVTSRHLANYNDTLRAAYRTAISAAQTCLFLCSAAFIITRTRTKLGEFSVSGSTTWNSLPESLKTVDCIATFKRQLKTHFLTFICVNIFRFALLRLLYCRPVPARCRPGTKQLILMLGSVY